ncbi:MAG: helix-turn-helix transcriptional regulator [Clostridia bacterium]|nr:helix-turn-helix transcriptional regulator [Clostridia bacterium]
MNNVYDVIDVLLEWRGFTMKELARHAGISYTTFASIMKRRPGKIAQRTLTRIGQVFGVDGHELLGLHEPFEPEQEYYGRNVNGERVGAVMSEDVVEYVLKHIIGEEYGLMIDRVMKNKAVVLAPEAEEIEPVKQNDLRRRFDTCVDLVFDHLSEAGVIEAMRYILELSQNPKFNISTDLQKKKEDTE